MSLRIRLRNADRNSKKSVPSNSPDDVSSSGRRKAANTRYSQAWRDRLKTDPVKFAEFKALEAERAREYRRKKSAAAKVSDKEKNRERQRKFRARKKEQSKNCEQIPKPKKRKVLTRKERTKKREYDRIKKREEREKMSAQKKRRIRERERREIR